MESYLPWLNVAANMAPAQNANRHRSRPLGPDHDGVGREVSCACVHGLGLLVGLGGREEPGRDGDAPYDADDHEVVYRALVRFVALRDEEPRHRDWLREGVRGEVVSESKERQQKTKSMKQNHQVITVLL